MRTTNLKALSKRGMELFVREAGLPVFRAKQILHWIYERRAQSLQEITELSKGMREKLSERAYISNLELLNRQVSRDGTEKFLFGLEDNETIESVLIPDEDRLTLCISSQVGCAMCCRFCLTGTLGLKRNLMPHEITDQIIAAGRLIAPRQITNIVFMGMGEPLANFNNVVEALWRITELLKISPRRITLSTSGIVPKIRELPERAPLVNLAISLNATTNEVRDSLMPVNRNYPLEELLKACREFPLPSRRRITFEYVLLGGINDSPEDARRLIRLLRGIPAKVNLIPFNPYGGAEFRRPEEERVLEFQEILTGGNITAFIRKSKGQDILAACGQLKAKYGGKG
ncbi:MAG: 23S rRNA (adenine(2503)-C(2))-methyltransferase RlmN [Alphaproteobacteria bacterium]|uniref:Probable dual-specificity RNA methyltransferase RlmN n=1 Tax=Candidatus Nitrobium versatile TaxID=2884831 RepID=A0A953JCE0_9BACT|nr:23S rRNA (adenine(2503)-C(2))-methyltransferase RlmN [Candidatus Nitrobium versatile]